MIATVEAREKGGEFTSLNDFIKRVAEINPSAVNKRALEYLIKCGGLDCLGGNRTQYLAVYEKTVDNVLGTLRNNISGQFSIFEEQKMEEELPRLKDFTQKVKLELEKEILGIYISGHPLDDYVELIKRMSSTNSNQIMEEYSVNTNLIMRNLRVAGIIKSKRTLITKNKKMMAFATLGRYFRAN